MQTKRKGRGGPNAIDAHVGSRVRERRAMLGWSQEKLGAALGLTFQQVQKYERGANRIGASRLFDLSRVLDVPVSFFYDGAEDVAADMPFLAADKPTLKDINRVRAIRDLKPEQGAAIDAMLASFRQQNEAEAPAIEEAA